MKNNNRVNNQILSTIIQLLTFEKIKKSGLSLEDGFKNKKGIFSVPDLDKADGLFAGIMSRFVLYSNTPIEELVKANIVELSGTYYFFDENDDEIQVDIEIENGEKLFFANGYEVEDEVIYPKYKIHENIVKEAIEIFETVKEFVEKTRFAFIEKSVRYVVPLYVVLLFKALRVIKNDEDAKISEILTEMLHEDKLIDEIKKTEDVSELVSFAIEAQNIDTGDWKGTITIDYNF